ncbi:MAG: TRAP transporter small permease [Phreatobacter sp.]
MTVEPEGQRGGPHRDAIGRAARALAVFGGCVMLAAAAMVSLSVLSRWLFKTGINGDFEMVQIATAVGVFAFLPLCQWGRGNVFVDTFTLKAPAWLNRGLDTLWDLTYAGFALLIAWRLSLGAYDAISSRTSSMVLAIPIGWAIAATAVMAAFLFIVTLATAARLRRGDQ